MTSPQTSPHSGSQRYRGNPLDHHYSRAYSMQSLCLLQLPPTQAERETNNFSKILGLNSHYSTSPKVIISLPNCKPHFYPHINYHTALIFSCPSPSLQFCSISPTLPSEPSGPAARLAAFSTSFAQQKASSTQRLSFLFCLPR